MTTKSALDVHNPFNDIGDIQDIYGIIGMICFKYGLCGFRSYELRTYQEVMHFFPFYHYIFQIIATF